GRIRAGSRPFASLRPGGRSRRHRKFWHRRMWVAGIRSPSAWWWICRHRWARGSRALRLSARKTRGDRRRSFFRTVWSSSRLRSWSHMVLYNLRGRLRARRGKRRAPERMAEARLGKVTTRVRTGHGFFRLTAGAEFVRPGPMSVPETEIKLEYETAPFLHS